MGPLYPRVSICCGRFPSACFKADIETVSSWSLTVEMVVDSQPKVQLQIQSLRCTNPWHKLGILNEKGSLQGIAKFRGEDQIEVF